MEVRTCASTLFRRAFSTARRRRVKTNAVHAGEPKNEITRASAPDICMSTTFGLDPLIDF